MIVKVQSASEFQTGIYYEYDTNSRPLGQGGMGVVYQGFCFHEGDRTQFIPVAVKKMTYTTPAMIDKAMREASIQLDHDNLLRMFGFIPNWEQDSVTGNSELRYYVVMEALWGVNLDNLLNGQLTDQYGNRCEYAEYLYQLYQTDRAEFVKHILENVLAGLGELHNRGYLHRDLDPSNIMITQDRKIKIIDFGISKKIDGSVSRNGGTVSGTLMGKVDYAPPEMVTGDVDHHDFTTDLYELGILAYQLYTGNLPFFGDSAYIAQCQLQTPVPVGNISDKTIRKVVKKATQKSQTDRYQSVAEMIEDFNLISDDPPVDPPVDPPIKKRSSIPNFLWVVCVVVGLAAGVVFRLIMSN